MFKQIAVAALLVQLALAVPAKHEHRRVIHKHNAAARSPTPTSAPTPTPYKPRPTPVTSPAPAPTGGSGSPGSTAYTFYQGDGSVADGWPAESDWVGDFETMWSSNTAEINAACANHGWGANNSEQETQEIHDAINSLSASSGIDARFVLAIVMQESGGCVRAPTTTYSVANPGLMQSHDGMGTCNPGTPTTPCPSTMITQMITDGTTGPQGLQQCLGAAPAGNAEAEGYYQAARFYNAGLSSGVSDLGAAGATRCYASDIANRLTGWNDLSSPTGCTLS